MSRKYEYPHRSIFYRSLDHGLMMDIRSIVYRSMVDIRSTVYSSADSIRLSLKGSDIRFRLLS